jgi:MFS family permease
MAADSFRRSQVSIAALFCFLGFQYGTWASRVPELKDRLALSEAEVGLLLLSTGVGAAVSFPLVSRLMRQYGSRLLAIASCAAMVLVLPALALAPDFPVALAVLFCDGVAVACLNVSMNAQGAALEARYTRNTMAKLHAVFSGGTLLAALLASAVVTVSTALALHFSIGAVLLVGLILLARTGLLASVEPAAASGKGRWSLPTRVTAWLGLAMVFGTVTEGAMNDWSALYLSDIAHAAAGLTPLGIAVVSGMMVLARLFADGWRARWGDERVVVGGALLAAGGLACALVAGGVTPALIGFGCVGLGMAAITPCLYVAAANQGPDALTLVAAMGTTGLLAGPPVIGFIANGSSLVWGMAAVAVSALLVAVCVVQVRDRLRQPVLSHTPGS